MRSAINKDMVKGLTLKISSSINLVKLTDFTKSLNFYDKLKFIFNEI